VTGRRPRRLRGGQRRRREDATALLGRPDVREGITALLGEATITAAFSERHLIGELPPSLWLRLEQMLDQFVRRPLDERKSFCDRQPEILRRLLALFVLDHEATARVINAKLGDRS
jgi:hypothetical protein